MKLPKIALALTYVKSRIGDDAKLSLGVGAACCCLGGIGWFVNYLHPGSTTLGAFAIIGVFYLLAGAASVLTTGRISSDSTRLAKAECASDVRSGDSRAA